MTTATQTACPQGETIKLNYTWSNEYGYLMILDTQKYFQAPYTLCIKLLKYFSFL